MANYLDRLSSETVESLMQQQGEINQTVLHNALLRKLELQALDLSELAGRNPHIAYAWTICGDCGFDEDFLSPVDRNEMPQLTINQDGTGELEIPDDEEDDRSTLSWLKSVIPSRTISAAKQCQHYTKLELDIPKEVKKDLCEGEDNWSIGKITKSSIEMDRLYARKGDLVLTITKWEHRPVDYHIFFENEKRGDERKQYIANLEAENERLTKMLVELEEATASTSSKKQNNNDDDAAGLVDKKRSKT